MRCKQLEMGTITTLLLCLLPALVLAAPTRVVSINMCTDQHLLQLADRAQIVSVSQYATNPAHSVVAEQAEGLPVNYGQAEAILRLKPELVLAGQYSGAATVAMLERLHIPVVKLPLARSLDDIRRNIRRMAEALGHPQRGEAQIATMNRRLAKLTANTSGPNVVAAFYEPNGYTIGEGTLAHQLLTHAGMDNLATGLGLPGHNPLPLEILLTHRPDLLIMSPLPERGDRASEALRHPALARAFDESQVVRIPKRLWVCGTPQVLDALALLNDARARVAQTIRTAR